MAAEEAPVFEFESGGPANFSPYGVWTLRLDAAGRLTLAHTVFGQTTAYGPVALEPPARAALAAAIAASGLAAWPDAAWQAHRPVPDEGYHTFRLAGPAAPRTVRVWRAQAQQAPAVAALLAHLGTLIAQVTGRPPVL